MAAALKVGAATQGVAKGPGVTQVSVADSGKVRRCQEGLLARMGAGARFLKRSTGNDDGTDSNYPRRHASMLDTANHAHSTNLVWHYSLAGARSGPVSIDRLLELLASGQLGPDVLVWTPGMASWQPARAIVALREAVLASWSLPTAEPSLLTPPPLPVAESEPSGIKLSSLTDSGRQEAAVLREEKPRPITSQPGSLTPKPWHRWLARILDVNLLGFLGGVAYGLLLPTSAEEANDIVYAFISAALLVPYDGLCAALGWRTYGKWLLNIHVRTAAGAPLTGIAAATRAGWVALKGLGLGIPIVSLVTMNVQYRALMKQGQTSYDRDEGFLISHGPVSVARWFAIVLSVVITVLVLTLGSLA